MENFNPKKLAELLKAGNKKEAGEYLKSLLAGDLTEAEEADAYIDFGLLYVKLMNAIDEEYKTALEEIFNDLRQLNKDKSQFDDKLKLAKVRTELG
jgi:hypothetical protein